MSEPSSENLLLKPSRPVGIVGYGAYVPRYRLPASEVARMWTGGKGGLPIKEKAVNGLGEDVITMSIEAARNALARAEIDPQYIRAVFPSSGKKRRLIRSWLSLPPEPWPRTTTSFG